MCEKDRDCHSPRFQFYGRIFKQRRSERAIDQGRVKEYRSHFLKRFEDFRAIVLNVLKSIAVKQTDA